MRVRLFVILIPVVLLIVYSISGYLWVDSAKQRSQHPELNSQITEVAEKLAETPNPPQDLEQRLSVAQASLDSEQTAFPGKLNSTRRKMFLHEMPWRCFCEQVPNRFETDCLFSDFLLP